MEPVAADPPLRPPALRKRVGRRPPRASSRGTPCRRRRRAARRAALARRLDRRRARVRCGAARAARRLAIAARTSSSITTGSAEPLAAVDDAVATASTASARPPRGRPRVESRPPSTRWSLRLVEPALTTRMPRASARRSVRPSRPARTRRTVAAPRVAFVAVSRVYARWRSRSSTICLAERARPASPRPGTRSITSITRWKRSRSFSMTMSNGVVVVPSSL